MAWWLSVDHGITSAVTPFNRLIDALYDDPADNPFHQMPGLNT